MSETELFSRARLCAISGAPEDAVVFWDRQGLIVGSQRGARAHKRYSRREVLIAALLNEVRRIGLNVSAMRSIIEKLRAALKLYDGLLKPKKWANLIGLPLGPDGDAEVRSWQSAWNLTEEEITDLMEARRAMPIGRDQDLWIAVDFHNPHAEIAAWPDATGEWRLATSVENVFREGGKSAVVVALGKAFDLPLPPIGDGAD